MNASVTTDRIFRAGVTLNHAEVLAWLRDLRGRPYVPASAYDVGAVLRVRAGGKRYYCAGVNVENADLALSVHGEGAALSVMLTTLGPAARVEEAWVMAAPRGMDADSADARANGGSCCGRCRQHLWEFAAGPDVKVHLVSLGGSIRTQPIGMILPGGFSFADFKPVNAAADDAPPDDAALLPRLTRGNAPEEAGMRAWLQELHPADLASGMAQAMALRFDNGSAMAGVRLEDAAFTGLSAAQGAVAPAVAAFGTFQIQHAYMLTQGGDMPADAVAPPSLAALQVLREFGSSRTPLSVFAPDGQVWRTNVTEAASYAPTHAKPWRRIMDGQLLR